MPLVKDGSSESDHIFVLLWLFLLGPFSLLVLLLFEFIKNFLVYDLNFEYFLEYLASYCFNILLIILLVVLIEAF